MVKALAFLAAVLLTCTSAWAKTPVPCVVLLGDFWGENPAPTDVKTIDGKSFKTPEALALAIGDGAVIRGGNFSEWDFRGVTLHNACFVEADLKGSVWTGARAPGVGFIRSDLADSAVTGIQAPGVLFRDAGLTNVKAQRANFSGGLYEGGWFDGSLDGWTIDDANLTDFIFSCGITLSDGCPVYSGEKAISARGTNFTRAKLSSFRRYGFSELALDGAILDRTELSPGQMVSLNGMALVHPVILTGGDAQVELSAQEAMALIADTTAYSQQIAGPSFDCARAASPVEKLLCSDTAGDLPSADRQLGMLFTQLRQQRPDLAASQRAWLKTRDACTRDPYPSDCLRKVYSDRIGQLLGIQGERDWLARGKAALFIYDEMPLSDAMRSSALFSRIAPVLANASMAHVYVTRAADGSHSASGEAVGANAHLCSLGASAMQLDPASGWYGVAERSESKTARVLRIIGDELEVFGDGHPDGASAEASMDYVSCGVRAAFWTLRRIALPAGMLARYADLADSGR